MPFWFQLRANDENWAEATMMPPMMPRGSWPLLRLRFLLVLLLLLLLWLPLT